MQLQAARRPDRAPGWVRQSRGVSRRLYVAGLIETKAKYGWRVNAHRVAHAAFEEYNTRQNMHPALRPANWQREHHQELVDRRNDLDMAAAQVVDAAYARAMEHRDRLAANRVLGLRDRPVADYADPDPPPRLPDVASLVSAARPGPAAGIAHAA